MWVCILYSFTKLTTHLRESQWRGSQLVRKISPGSILSEPRARGKSQSLLLPPTHYVCVDESRLNCTSGNNLRKASGQVHLSSGDLREGCLTSLCLVYRVRVIIIVVSYGRLRITYIPTHRICRSVCGNTHQPFIIIIIITSCHLDFSQLPEARHHPFLILTFLATWILPPFQTFLVPLWMFLFKMVTFLKKIVLERKVGQHTHLGV